MFRHHLDRSTATQIVRGAISIDKVLHGRRRREHLATHRNRCFFDKAAKDGRPRLMAMHGQQVRFVRIRSARKYEVDFIPLGHDMKPSGTMETAHKLEFKFGSHLEHAAKMHNAIQFCESSASTADTIVKPQDRYCISDRKLYGWLDAASRICVKTLEGDMVKGTVSWIGRWEIGLSVNDAELVVFRHALANIQGFRWGSLKDD